MEFLVLGPLRIRVADGEPRGIRATKPRMLLGLLLVHANQVVSADRLLEELWGDDQPAGGVGTLRYHASKLRDVLDPDRARGEEGVIATEAGGYVLRVAPDQVDAGRFEVLAGEGARLLVEGKVGAARERLGEALGLWRGGAFEDFRYDSFAQGEIAQLEEMRLLGVENRVAADLELGRHREVVGELRELTTGYPMRERLWGQLMVALYRTDQQAEALKSYQTARTVLGDELGIEPNAALRRLEEQILLHELPFEPPPVEAARGDNLPARVDSFIGRSDEIAAVEDLLSDRRLVTLTGFAGIGKTTLALEVARRGIGSHPDGVWLVELAALSDPSFVVEEIANVLKVQAHPTRLFIDVMIEDLAAASMLVVVDNCEHLLTETARVIDALLEACPDLRVLATSREPLRVAGEQVWPVLPLALPEGTERPSLAAALETDAVRLFVERARQAQPGFELDDINVDQAVAIGRRLDGIPLALELAAGRLRVLSPRQLLDRLEDHFAVLTGGGTRPERHRTLGAAIEWSCNLLNEPEQAMLQRLAVFEGGCTLAAVEDVCSGDGIDRADVLDLTSRLLDASLLTVAAGEPRRYGMLQAVQQYAQALLADSGEETEVRRRHADYFFGLFSREPDFNSVEFGEMQKQLAADQDNLRRALTWAVEAGDGVRALRVAAKFWRFWSSDALSEILYWFPQVLDLTETTPSVDRARVLNALGTALSWSGRPQEAGAIVAELNSAVEHLDERIVALYAAVLEGIHLAAMSDLRGSRRVLMDYVGTLRDRQEPGLSAVFSNMARTSVCLGDFAHAAAMIEELEELAATLNQPMTLALATELRGTLAHYQGNLAAAGRLFGEALGEMRRLNPTESKGSVLRDLARVSLATGDSDDAAQWARQSVDSGRRAVNTGLMTEGYTLVARAALGQGLSPVARQAATEALDIAADTGNTWSLALVVATVAQLVWTSGDASTSAVLHGGAETLRTRIGFVHPIPRSRQLEGDYLQVRTALGSDAFNTAWQNGASLSPDDLTERARTALNDRATT